MYRVVYKYKNGKSGVCRENGATMLFDTEDAATAYAEDLNGRITDEAVRRFLPVWYAEKAE